MSLLRCSRISSLYRAAVVVHLRLFTSDVGGAAFGFSTPTADQVISHFHTCETMRILVNPRETVRSCAKRRVKLCEIHVKFHVKVAQSPVKVTRKRNKRRETCEIRVKLRSRAKPREAARSRTKRARTRAKARESARNARETRAKRARNARETRETMRETVRNGAESVI